MSVVEEGKFVYTLRITSHATFVTGRLIASSTLWQIASQTVMAALSIVTIKFVAIGLSTELAGTYQSAYGFLQIFGILADFGLYAVAVREVSRQREEDRPRVLGAIIMLRALITVLSLGTALVIAWLVPVWQGTPLPLSITIAAFVPFFTLLAGIRRTVFQVHYRMRGVFVAEVSQRIVAVFLIGAVIAAGVRDSTDPAILQLFLLSGSIGALILLLLSIFLSRRLLIPVLRWDGAEIRRLLALAAPYGIAFLCTALYRQTDVTLIALLRPDYELQNAYYGFAMRAVEMGYLIPTFLLNSTLPSLSERDAQGHDTRAFLGKILLTILLTGAIMALYAALWSRPIMLLLTRPEFVSGGEVLAGADTALRLLALPLFLNGIVLFAFYSLLTRHVWRPLVAILSLGAVLSILLNVLLIPSLGFVGAAYTSMVLHVLLALVLFLVSRRVLPVSLPRPLLLRFLLLIVLFGIVLLLFQPFLTSSLLTVLLGIVSVAMLGLLVRITGIRTLL